MFALLKTSVSNAGEIRGVTERTIRMGTIGDLTGPIATSWLAVADALRDYFRHVNDNGGIHGRHIINTFEDDRYTIPLALSSFKKLVYRDRVLLLMAASGVGHTHSIIPLAEKHKVPMIAQTNNYNYFHPVRKYIFTAIPFYEDQIKLIFEYIFEDLKSQNPAIALAYTDTASGHISRDTCRKMTKKYKPANYVEAIISVGAADVTSQILNVKRSKPDFVIIHGYTGSTSAFMRDAYKLKLKSNFIVIQYGCVDDVVRIAGIAAKDLMGTNCFNPWNDDSPGITKLRQTVMKYHPGTEWKNRNFTQGWFAGMLIHNGLKNAGRDLRPETVVEGLERIYNFDTGGICGIVSFGPDDHKPIDYSRFYKADVDKKQFVPISDWRKPKE